MRHASILVILSVVVCCSWAQNPKTYKTILYDHFTAKGEYIIPAPEGWHAAFIGIRNNTKQQLASIDFYNDSLISYAQTGIPRITILDAVACADSTGTQALYFLASDRASYSLLRLDMNRSIARVATIDPGENQLTPQRTALEFIGAVAPHDSIRVPSFVFLAHLNDEPFRYVIATCNVYGNTLWQYALGAGAVHPFLATTESDTSGVPKIIFSTDAAPHETNDTLRFSAQKSVACALSLGGTLAWTCLLGERGTSSWCTMATIGTRRLLACAAMHTDGGELFLLDPHNGVTEYFRHTEGSILPRTLNVTNNTVTIAEQPDTLVQFDSSLKETSVSILPPVVDSTSTMIDLPGDEGHHLLFSLTRSVILSEDYDMIGILPEGMIYSRTGIARFSGVHLRNSILFCAEDANGSSLRTEAPNRTWWWYKYRTAGGIALGVALFFALVLFVARRFYFYRTYYNQLVRSSTSTGIIALNRQQRVIHINNAARDLLNIARYIPLQRHLTEYLPSAAFADIIAITRECMQTRRPHEKIIALQENTQSRTLLSRARPTVSRGGILAGCILQIEDITRTIDRERLLNWASVAHHIAHEMKTPIGTVLLNAQHLQKTEEEIPDKSRKYLQRIVLQTDRLSAILQTFLRIARFNAMNFSTVNIENLVRSLAAEYADLVPPNITVKYAPTDIDATIDVDNEQLTTALRNIIDNAVNAINPRPGTITISLDGRSSPAGDFIIIIIRDDGKGMSDTCKARLFEPFYTETTGGSGIGMMIVKRIIDEHKGFIEIDSEEGKGTEIRILLPRAAAD